MAILPGNKAYKYSISTSARILLDRQNIHCDSKVCRREIAYARRG
jgi:hypothetical protein